VSSTSFHPLWHQDYLFSKAQVNCYHYYYHYFYYLSSFHKRSTRDFLLKMIREDWGFAESEVVAEMKFDIPNSYKFHKCKTKDVEVDLIRICMVNHDNVGVGVGDNGDTIGEGRDCYGDADGGNLEHDDDENYKTHTQEGGNSNNIDEPK